MFGLGKKKEPVILGGSSERVPGMPEGLYSSRDVENLRFHDKRRVWYNAKQVDDALDKVQATLEWWEAKSGWKPSAGDAVSIPADKDEVEGGPLDVRVPEAVASAAVLAAVDGEEKPDEAASLTDSHVMEGTVESSSTSLASGPKGVDAEAGDLGDALNYRTSSTETTEAQAESADDAGDVIDPLSDAPADGNALDGDGWSTSAVPIPTFDLGLARNAGDEQTDREPDESAYGGSVLKTESTKTTMGELPKIVGRPDEPTVVVKPISLPPVPSVPTIPTNPFLRRR